MFKPTKTNKVTVFSSISKTVYENLESENAKKLATQFFNDNELVYVNDKFFNPNPLTPDQIKSELKEIFKQL